MNKDELLIKSTCRIKCGIHKGSGFFVSPSLILTAEHVIHEVTLVRDLSVVITNCGEAEEEYTGMLVDYCELCDFALIRLNGEYTNPIHLSLCYSELVKDEYFDAYGYPNTFDGNHIGEPLEGTIFRTIENSTDTIHDINLDVRGYSNTKQYDGFSGSPMINERSEVVAIIRYLNQNYLSGVTIKKAKPFLERNNIKFKSDSLGCFDRYKGDAFSGFEDRRLDCETKAGEIIKIIDPQRILDSKKGELFYPKKDKSIDEIIAYLKTSKVVDEHLWKGWMQLLTFIGFIKGNFTEINHIKITLSRTEISKKFGFLKTQNPVETPVVINFYFTEDETYSSIVKKYIHGEFTKGSLAKNACHIFNSHQENFGTKIESANMIIKDISGLENSGPSIYGVSIGVLSLKQLRDKVINSDSLQNITSDLKKLIENAIS